MLELLAVATGGALGALLRFSAVALARRLHDGAVPLGTLLVNLSGCLAIGIAWAGAEQVLLAPELSAFIFVGLLGAFTTFSTYSLESVNLLRSERFLLAGAYFLASNLGGFTLAYLGLLLGGLLV